jgi:3,4-dihydroxy 2-butanone 4-phosphate synthase/GTP cyclohydrolase II
MSTLVDKAIAELKNGKMIILTDNANRENEGDLIFPAENASAQTINMMLKHCSGIICLSLPSEVIKKLNLPLMISTDDNTSGHCTPFTVSIEAKIGVTTGVSALDRATTILAAINDAAQPSDLVRPGHVFPLRAQDGGVLTRAGHTEGSLDLVKLAGFKPAAVLCEVMNEDGTMCKGEQLTAFAKRHDIMMLSIDDIIDYRRSHEDLIADTAETNIILDHYGEFTIKVITEKFSKQEHIVLSKPAVNQAQPLLVRMHSSCITGDIFSSLHCDCHAQLHHSLQRLSDEGGLLIYLNQEGRGIGLFNKIKAYALQKTGLDTVDANLQLGLEADSREYYIAANILRTMKVNEVRLLTNNPHKLSNLNKFCNIAILREPLPLFDNAHNKDYLMAKQNKLNHFSDPTT